jgi:hypothetical protein
MVIAGSVAGLGNTVVMSVANPGSSNPGGGGAGASQSGPLDGKRQIEVRDPASAKLITDIDLVEYGVLWEEKSAVFATDVAKWVSKQITGKFTSYLRARQHLPGYQDAPIGFRFPRKPVDPARERAIIVGIDSLRSTNPGVDIRLEWRA